MLPRASGSAERGHLASPCLSAPARPGASDQGRRADPFSRWGEEEGVQPRPPPHFALLIAFAVFRTLQLHQAAGRIQSDFQLRIPPLCGPFAVKDPRSQAPLWPLGLCWSLLTTHRGALFSPEGLATTPQGQGCLGADRGPAPRFAVLLDQHRDLWALTLRRKRPRGRH